MHPAIRVDRIGKHYRLGTHVGAYRTLGETLGGAMNSSWRGVRRLIAPPPPATTANPAEVQPQGSFWALKDVSFDVQPGEVVGIIGSNGAGKSTLLKLLSRITEPTTGRIELRGRVGSLLEVGTGFHPELTGRENIYLNGSILGMARREIQRSFDDIVEFSGVAQFLDTPVKRYSSGMYVRLAFAVAAYLEPEILLVDEVLAVGDAEFQRKCLGKMSTVAESGRTVLFVSHNMAAVSRLCSRTIVIEHGQIGFQGEVHKAIERYGARLDQSRGHVCLQEVKNRTGSQKAKFTSISFQNDAGNEVTTVPMGESLNVVLRFHTAQPVAGLEFGIAIADGTGQRLFRVQTSETIPSQLATSRSEGEIRCRLPRVPLVPGVYWLSIGMTCRGVETLDRLVDVASFAVQEADVFATGKFPDRASGSFLVDSEWNVDRL